MNKFRLVLCFIVALSVRIDAAAFLRNTDSGGPYTWQAGSTITYRVDNGTLGALSKDQGKDMVSQSFAAWTSIDSASGISTVAGSDLSEDVKASNITDYVSVTADGFLTTVTGDSIIIFDDNGSIFDLLFGSGAGNQILGVASPAKLDASTGHITAGLAIINGTFTGPEEINTLEATVIHELGHFFNLGHSQVNIEAAANSSTSDDNTIPTMFPYSLGDDTELISLHADDKDSFSRLYPNNSVIASKGLIQGKIVDRNGRGLSSAYVICENIADGTKSVSDISDQSGTSDGQFKCTNLEDGTYRVEIQPIIVAIRNFSVDPPAYFTEYYNGADESYNQNIDDRSQFDEIVIDSSNRSAEANIVMNENGQIQVGKTKTSSFALGSYSFDHVLDIPAGVSQATVTATTSTSGAKLRLYARCGSAFSFSPTDGGSDFASDQGTFVGSGTDKERTVTLTVPDEGCRYHFMIKDDNTTPMNYEYELTATAGDFRPTLKFESIKAETATLSLGETDTWVSSIDISASGDSFSIQSLNLIDSGTQGLAQVQNISLYQDLNGDGEFDDEDTLVGSASVNSGLAETLSFDSELLLASGSTKRLFVVYTLNPSTQNSRFEGIVLFLLVGFFLAGLKVRKSSKLLGLILLLLSQVQCAKGLDRVEFQPSISGNAGLTAEAQNFGVQFSISSPATSEAVVLDQFR